MHVRLSKDSFEQLKIGIVKQAVVDYIKWSVELRKLEAEYEEFPNRITMKHIMEHRGKLDSLVRWFNSGTYSELTTVSPKYMFNVMNKRVENILAGGRDELYNCRGRLTKEDVQYIRKVYIKRDRQFGAQVLSRKFDVRSETILDIANFRTWKDA